MQRLWTLAPLALLVLAFSAAPSAAQARGGWRTPGQPQGWTTTPRGQASNSQGRRGRRSQDWSGSRSGPVRGSVQVHRGGASSGYRAGVQTHGFRGSASPRYRQADARYSSRGGVRIGRTGVTFRPMTSGASVRVTPRGGVTYCGPAPGGRVVVSTGGGGTTFRYRSRVIDYTQRWEPRNTPEVVTRPRVVVVDCPQPNASGAPVIVAPARPYYPRRVIVSEPEPAPEPAPEFVVEATPLRTAQPRSSEGGVPRSPRPRADAPRSSNPSLADRLLSKLSAADLLGACEIAAWAKDDPRREDMLRTALYARFPSPTLLRDAAERLAQDKECAAQAGYETLNRLLAGR